MGNVIDITDHCLKMRAFNFIAHLFNKDSETALDYIIAVTPEPYLDIMAEIIKAEMTRLGYKVTRLDLRRHLEETSTSSTL